MQTPVRYYITQSDDQAVVRTVPVAVQPVSRDQDASKDTIQSVAAPERRAETQPRRQRVGRIVRAATRRADGHQDQ